MVKEFDVPWAAWREPETIKLTFPDNWDVSLCKMNGADAPELSQDDIRSALNNPIGTPKLSELAKGKEKVVIVVDDMTRTTPVSRIIPSVLEELEKASINKDQITILIALGAHKPMTRDDCILKLGKEIVDTINIENHHPYENLTNLGESALGTPIDVNTTYVNSDLKISLGGVIPHPLAGFGGGAKIVLPGVCGINTLEANHSAGVRGIGAGIARMTQLREDIEDIADKVGLDFSINVILSERGEIADITAGHYRDAHRKAMEIAEKNYSTSYTVNNNICFFNCFPEDSELNQATKGFNFLLTAKRTMLDKTGTIVLMTSSYEGRGFHSLLAETGSKLYANFGDGVLWRALVKKRNVCLYSPNISKYDLYHLFPETTKLFSSWEDLINHLSQIHGDAPKAAVFPCSIQIGETRG